MRSGFNSLAAKVQTVLERDPFSGLLFVFRGKHGDLVKVPWWSGDGMCLLMKRCRVCPWQHGPHELAQAKYRPGGFLQRIWIKLKWGKRAADGQCKPVRNRQVIPKLDCLPVCNIFPNRT